MPSVHLKRDDCKLSPVPPRDCFGVFIHANYENRLMNERYVPQIGSNNIFLKHNTNYGVGIFNGSDGQAIATIYIGSECIGKFRIESKDCILIKRSIKIPRKFTFISKSNGNEYQNVIFTNNDSSIVKVIIYPQDMNEQSPSYFVNSYDIPRNLPINESDKLMHHYDCPDSPTNETNTVKEDNDLFMKTGYQRPPFGAMSVETDSCSIRKPPFASLSVETDSYLKEENKCHHNLVKNKGITVMGSHVKQNFRLEK